MLDMPTVKEKKRYLLHHLVLNPKRSDKSGSVFNYTVKSQGTSPSNRLLHEPVWTTSLIKDLCCFRKRKFTTSTETGEAFLHLKVPSKYRSALHSLWWAENDMVEYWMTSHPPGTAGRSGLGNNFQNQTASEF